MDSISRGDAIALAASEAASGRSVIMVAPSLTEHEAGHRAGIRASLGVAVTWHGGSHSPAMARHVDSGGSVRFMAFTQSRASFAGIDADLVILDGGAEVVPDRNVAGELFLIIARSGGKMVRVLS